MDMPLSASDEPNRYSIQPYHSTATQVDSTVNGCWKSVVGRGGSASYLLRTLHQAFDTGLDLNPAGIDFCQNRHKLGLEFRQGDAEDLPFANQSFGAVIDIESSLLYSRFRRCLAEIARV